jgi:uncharacterized protein (DUF2141 family)
MTVLIKLALTLVFMFHLGLKGQDLLVAEVTGMKDLSGDLYFSLYDRESAWMHPDSAYKKVMVPVNDGPEVVTLENIPEGDYAIAIYLDINKNGILDETEIKIPKEPFGFSNNPKGIRGPASFQQALFHFDRRDTLHIELVNNIFTPNKEKDEKKKK